MDLSSRREKRVAKAKVTLPKDIDKRLKLLVANAIKNSNVEENSKKEFVKSIRNGDVPSENNWPDISDKWSRRRDKLKSAGQKTDKSFSSSSNTATFSGEFLDKIKVVFVTSILELRIFASGGHRGYINLRGGERYKSGKKEGKTVPRRGKSTKNATIAKGLADQGRDIFKLTDSFRKAFIKNVKKAVQRTGR